MSSNAAPEFRWVDDWTQVEGEPGPGQAHTSVVVTRGGEVVFAHSSRAELVVRDQSGRVRDPIPVPGVSEFHGLAVCGAPGAETLWIADTGRKSWGGSAAMRVERNPVGGRVVAVDRQGRLLNELPTPPHEAYRDPDGYVPTAVAVDDPDDGGSGDIWVADGYGASLVHRFGPGGNLVATLSGDEGEGRFRQPHGLVIDRRAAVPRVLVADRQNRRIQAFDLEGRYLTTFGEQSLVAPSCLATHESFLVVTDLLAGRVTFFDSHDRPLGHVFPNPSPLAWGAPALSDGWPDGWPNERDQAGSLVRPTLSPEAFHSPHGVAVDTEGNVYVAEFLIGGRPIKLENLLSRPRTVHAAGS